MIRLIVFGVIGVCLLLLIVATYWGFRWAEKKGLPRKKRWLWAAAGFMLVYLLVFGDWTPTVYTHQYYCARNSGFWVYKTIGQWKAENPGVLETLVNNRNAPEKKVRSEHSETQTYFLNDRFNLVVKFEDASYSLPIIKTEQQVVDAKTGAILARYVDFWVGNTVRGITDPSGLMGFWMVSRHCLGGGYNKNSLYEFEHGVRGVEK